ncbi:peroxiredoxin [Robiginitalea sp. M366]|uniref:peroxiredoxin n=1 Tax=Robiginitalea aestuariiviva TaxID=3036903 RepID=UPI00240E3B4A|nr:peroxiredoxin [Robiginitalea aestuariiviva]MDG1573179.1 peroxiredoxin [Robiginitalea aestuariiviva]
MGLSIGSKAPEFTLQDQDGQTFRLSEHLGTQPVVVFFYPKDFTPGCTAEVCSFRDSYEAFTDAGALVIGISADTEESHHKFASRYRVPFRLLSDPQGKARRAFGVEARMFGLLPGRETFVIDRGGTIALAFRSLHFKGHMDQALNALKKLK